MPGPVIARTSLYPEWAQPENASVFDPPYRAPLRTIIRLLGLDDPQQVMMLGTPLEPPTPELGGLLGEVAKRFPRLVNAIKAYHGSPHDFEQFSMEKIGTGEGAQVYGHGLYFAENPDVAKAYRERLAGRPEPKTLTIDDYPVWPAKGGSSFEWEEAASNPTLRSGLLELHPRAYYAKPGPEGLARIRADLEASITNIEKEHAKGQTISGSLAEDRYNLQGYRDALATLDHYGDRLKIAPPVTPGRTYEVNIHADPAHFLDWDKPLSQQTPPVRHALEQLGYRGEPAGREWLTYTDQIIGAAKTTKQGQEAITLARDMIAGRQPRSGPASASLWKRLDKLAPGVDHNMIHDIASGPTFGDTRTGADIYSGLGGREEAAMRLRQAGIPGIKYLDQSSRAAGEGTRNYVVFDDQLIDILKKYGIALPLAGAAYQSAQPQR